MSKKIQCKVFSVIDAYGHQKHLVANKLELENYVLEISLNPALDLIPGAGDGLQRFAAHPGRSHQHQDH